MDARAQWTAVSIYKVGTYSLTGGAEQSEEERKLKNTTAVVNSLFQVFNADFGSPSLEESCPTTYAYLESLGFPSLLRMELHLDGFLC